MVGFELESSAPPPAPIKKTSPCLWRRQYAIEMASCATSISAGGTCLPLSASSIIASTPDGQMEENDARAGRV